jgi:hypothetical protein
LPCPRQFLELYQEDRREQEEFVESIEEGRAKQGANASEEDDEVKYADPVKEGRS